jgi:opacity protein-like surface antigen
MRTLLFAAAATALILPATHARSEPYVGASLGHSQLRADDYGANLQEAFTTLFAVSQARLDMDRTAGGRIFAGMNVAPWLALELDYTNLGTVANEYHFISIHGAILGHSEVAGRSKVDALGLSAILRARLWEGFTGHLRAGVARTRLRGDQESCFHGSVPPTITCASHGGDVSQTRPVAGLGLEYRVSDHWEARLGWDRYFGIGKSPESYPFTSTASVPGPGKFDVDFFAFGAAYRF